MGCLFPPGFYGSWGFKTRSLCLCDELVTYCVVSSATETFHFSHNIVLLFLVGTHLDLLWILVLDHFYHPFSSRLQGGWTVLLIKMVCMSTRRTTTKELQTWWFVNSRNIFLAALHPDKNKMKGPEVLNDGSFWFIAIWLLRKTSQVEKFLFYIKIQWSSVFCSQYLINIQRS